MNVSSPAPVRPLPAIVYLAIVVLPLAGAGWAIEHGASEPLSAVAAHVTAAGVILPLERWRPSSREPRAARRDLHVDLKHLVVGTLFGSALWRLLAVLIAASVPAKAGRWPTSWPLVVQLVLALLVFELVQYVIHVAMHRVPRLWAIHAVHHSSEKLDLPSTFRNHPLDVAITVVVPLLPIALLGGGQRLVLLTGVAVGVHSMVQHANIDFAASTFDWFVSTARLHRVHHAREVSDGAANYGGTLILWDVLLGTRKALATRDVVDVGLADGSRFPRSYRGQLLHPFRAPRR